MSLIIGFLTFILVLNCLLLILLVLIQLPKKEAGAGIAFGAGATDALFGAGSGNALTKMTKYAGALFLGLALALTYLNAQKARSGSKSLEKALSSQSVPAAIPRPATPATNGQLVPLQTAVPAAAAKATNLISTNLISTSLTNAPAK